MMDVIEWVRGGLEQGEARFQIKTLRGLSGIHLIIDSFDPSGIAQSSRARIRNVVEGALRTAGVRVLSYEEYEDAPMHGALHVALTVNDFASAGFGLYAFALTIELMQAVRLMRDKSIITYSPTWKTLMLGASLAGGVGEAIEEALLNRVDLFLDAFRAANQAD